MKKISSLLGIVSLLLAAGCASNVKQIGSVGDVQFYRVRANSFSGPNIASLVTKNTNSGEVKIEQTYAGPGLGAATISAVGHVGAAAVLGTSFPKNVGDNINATGGVTSSVANGGNSSSHSNSAGGAGGNSSSTSTSSSQAGSTSTAAAGGKSHPDSPGNGGDPGNGGQNNPHNP